MLNQYYHSILHTAWKVSKHGPEITSYLDTFHAVTLSQLTCSARVRRATSPGYKCTIHCVKRVRIWSYSGPHFSRIFLHLDWIRRDTSYLSVFSLNSGKIWTRITPNTDIFYAVVLATEIQLSSADIFLLLLYHVRTPSINF